MKFTTKEVEDLRSFLQEIVNDYKDKEFTGKAALLHAYAILGWANTNKN